MNLNPHLISITTGAAQRKIHRRASFWKQHRSEATGVPSAERTTGARAPLLVLVPPKVSISDLVGILKGRTVIRISKQFPHLKKMPYWCSHFWAPAYCVDTVGPNEEMIRKSVKFQEQKERHEEQFKLKY